jgi:hypothetical protein
MEDTVTGDQILKKLDKYMKLSLKNIISKVQNVNTVSSGW